MDDRRPVLPAPGAPRLEESGAETLAVVEALVVEGVEDDGQPGAAVHLEKIAQVEEPVVVLCGKAAADGRRQAFARGGEPFDRRLPVAVDAADVELDLRRRPELHRVEQEGVVLELPDAPVDDARVGGVEHDELVRMHRDPHGVTFRVPPDPPQPFAEEPCPVDAADGMRGKGDDIR